MCRISYCKYSDLPKYIYKIYLSFKIPHISDNLLLCLIYGVTLFYKAKCIDIIIYKTPNIKLRKLKPLNVTNIKKR